MTYVARNTSEETSNISEIQELKNSQSSNKSFFNQISPKSALIVGLIMSMLVICTIGFFVLLALFIRNG